MRAHVDVQRLSDSLHRIGGARVQAAQLDVRAEHVAHALEHVGQHDRAAEHLALVDQIGEPVGVLFCLELAAGALALLVEDLVNPAAQFGKELTAHASSRRT